LPVEHVAVGNGLTLLLFKDGTHNLWPADKAAQFNPSKEIKNFKSEQTFLG
jgi:hypothetical protein